MRIHFFGPSLLSEGWYDGVTYYRGVLAALADHGHRITLHDPTWSDGSTRAPLPAPSWAIVEAYAASDEVDAARAVERAARDADVLVAASSVGSLDPILEAAILAWRRPGALAFYWDAHGSALERLAHDPTDVLRGLLREYDAVLTSGDGAALAKAYAAFGARRFMAIDDARELESVFESALPSPFSPARPR
jgi:hypothetical protein